ncbi:MAG TPA: hypothetical protein VMU80_23450 [Bryobacteraceae bacterium]|nr:hypothetical protein [Bryobacteraceae bacterium]
MVRALILKTVKTAILMMAMTVLTHLARAAELQSATLLAWNSYVTESDWRLEQRVSGRQAFLWIDESGRAKRLRKGESVIAPMVERGSEAVPGGLIHHWIGAIFIPGAKIDEVWAVTRDYDNYQRVYRPAVTASKTLLIAGETQEFEMVWQRRVLFVSAAMQGHYRSRNGLINERRGYSVTDATEVREIEEYGRAEERLLPPNTGHGFIWRIRSIARYEERDGGVYLEVEALALTRDIPKGLVWVVNPVINHLSVNSLDCTLRQTLAAVIAWRDKAGSEAALPRHSSTEGGAGRLGAFQ